MGVCLSSQCANDTGQVARTTGESTDQSDGTIDLQCSILFCRESLSKVEFFTLAQSSPRELSMFSKLLQGVEYEILNDWFQTLVANHSCHLDLISRSSPPSDATSNDSAVR